MGVIKRYNDQTTQWEPLVVGGLGYTGSASTVVGYTGSQGSQGVTGYTGSIGPVGGVSYTVTNSGASDYVINGANDPTINLIKGFTYYFNITASGHPFWIKTSQTTGTGDAYTSGVTNNGTDSGQIVFTVPYDAPATLYYICQFHSGMSGTFNISDYVTATSTQTLTNKTITAMDSNSSIVDSGGVNSYTVGYRQMPQNTQSSAYTLVNSDEGKHIYYTGSTANITIPTDGSTTGGNFAVGSVISIINHGSGNVTVLHSGNLFFAGNTTSASRVISPKGIATIIKVAANVWYISGGGVA